MSLSKFLDYMRFEKHYSKHTTVAYENDLREFSSFLLEHFEQKEISEANYSQIRSWIVTMVDSGLSNRSINRKISSLKAFYRFLLKTKQLENSPLAAHKALKTAKKLQIPFSKTEVTNTLSLFEAGQFEEIRNKLIVELLYTTGIRRTELIHIKLSELNLSQKTLKVLGKRNKERIVPLLEMLVETIQEYLKYRKEVETPTSGDYLLLTKKGVKLNETLVYRLINSYFGQVSGKVKKSPHILRHSFATHLLNNGANMNAVKELLGHTSLASTQEYTHTNMDELSKIHNTAHPRNKK